MRRLASFVLLSIIRFYRNFVSPLLPRSCRYHPSCSVYAGEAIRRYGPCRGSAMAARRILRCNPFHPGGFDPLP